MFFFLSLFLLSTVLGSPLGDYEKELKKEGLNVEKIHTLLKEESAEVEQEFSGKDVQTELTKLRSAYPSNLTLTHIKSVLDINGDLAKDLFEGDIMLSLEQWKVALDKDPNNPMQRRQALTSAVQLWKPMGAPVIPYSYEPGFPADQKSVILEALRFWEQRTCIRFRPATQADTAFVSFNHKSRGCSSYVGRTGDKQTVNLNPNGCMSLTIIAHEVSHAFGTLHVQSRSDRDKYVTIDTANIKNGTEHNFMKDPSFYGPLSLYGIPYEFGSMQHYYEKAFAIDNNRPTIFAKPAYSQYQYSMEAPRATFYDTLLINTMYKCTAKCQNIIACQNNGVQDGSDCNKCFCPRGWSGTYCEKRPADAQIVNISGPQTLPFRFTGRNGEESEKLYIVQAPVGKRIVVNIARIGINYDRCINAGVEIVTTRDTRPSGFRFCAPSRIRPLVSESNTVLIWAYSYTNWKLDPAYISFRLL